MKFSIGKIRLTIGRKLALGFGIVLALLIAGRGVSVYGIRHLGAAAEELVLAESVKAAADGVLLGKLSSVAKLRHYFSTGDTDLLAESSEAHHETEESLTTIKEYRAVALAAELRALEAAHHTHADMLDAATVAYRKNPNNVAAVMAKLDEADTFFEENMVSYIEAIREHERATMEATVASARDLVYQRLAVTFFVNVLSLIVGIAAAFIIGRGITRAARQLNTVAASISRGDMDVPIEVKTNDEMKDLGDSIDRMRASLKAAIERLQIRQAAG